MLFSRRRGRLSFAWVLLWLGVTLSALSLVSRARHEAAPASVEIALEWDNATRLASAQGVPLERWLRAMKSRGARGVTLDVESVRELGQSGRLTLLGRAEASALLPATARLPGDYRFVILCRDAALMARVRAAFEGHRLTKPAMALAPDALAVALSNASLSAWPIGLDGAAIEILRRAKMEPIARLSDWTGLTPTRLDALFGQLRAVGARIVVMGAASSKVSAPGDVTLLPLTARLLRRHGLSLAWIEADQTRGTPALARLSEGFIVRAHRISSVDSLSLEPGQIVDRYARAARERNVRLFLIQMRAACAAQPTPKCH